MRAPKAVALVVALTSIVACDNTPPSVPTIAVVTATGNSITGSIDACVDDGKPNPPGDCSQTAFAVHGTVSCDEACDCTGALAGDGEASVSGGSWTITGLAHDTNYMVYGKSSDSVLGRCSVGIPYTTPATVAGCVRHSAIQRTQFTADIPGSGKAPGPQAGGIAAWRLQQLVASDWMFGGLVQQAIWVGVDGKSARDQWIETGVTQGAELTPGVVGDVRRYFTAFGINTGNPATDPFATVLLPGTPVQGNTEYSKVVNCRSNDPGCPQPWNATTSPKTWVACVDVGAVGNQTSNCFVWTESLARSLTANPTITLKEGSNDFHIGLESTCGSSQMNTTKVSDIRYRTPPSAHWSNIDNIHWLRTSLFKGPQPSNIHGTDCCNGVITLPGNSDGECVAPKDFIVFLNTSTTTQVPQACN